MTGLLRAALALAALAACDGGREVAGGESATGALYEGSISKEELAAARGQAYQLWRDIDEQYPSWPTASPAPVPAEEPHGAWVRVHYNDVAAAAAGATGPWPEGSIIAVEDFAPDPDGPGALEAVNVMQRRADGWFWARFTPPDVLGPRRLTRRTDIPIAGGDLLRCASCHRQLARRDHVISELR